MLADSISGEGHFLRASSFLNVSSHVVKGSGPGVGGEEALWGFFFFIRH